jgi:hypothetical protein
MVYYRGIFITLAQVFIGKDVSDNEKSFMKFVSCRSNFRKRRLQKLFRSPVPFRIGHKKPETIFRSGKTPPGGSVVKTFLFRH